MKNDNLNLKRVVLELKNLGVRNKLISFLKEKKVEKIEGTYKNFIILKVDKKNIDFLNTYKKSILIHIQE